MRPTRSYQIAPHTDTKQALSDRAPHQRQVNFIRLSSIPTLVRPYQAELHTNVNQATRPYQAEFHTDTNQDLLGRAPLMLTRLYWTEIRPHQAKPLYQYQSGLIEQSVRTTPTKHYWVKLPYLYLLDLIRQGLLYRTAWFWWHII